MTDLAPREVTLSNGIVIGVRRRPPAANLVYAAQSKIKVPTVPKVYIEDQDRYEDNPDDPAYAAAMLQYREEIAVATAEVRLMFATRLISVPEGYCRPEDPEWIPEVRDITEAMDLDVTIREEPDRARYIDWLKYYAATSETDYLYLIAVASALHEMTDEQVDELIARFRRHGWRGIDPEPAEAAGDPHGDISLTADPGDRGGVGAAGGGEVQPDPVAPVGDAPHE